ncbi:MAG: bifunctional (p)ppGpp synthetase/guanosine-3',5'-bis(diphosphate) 3'-pyrophosphohydrolase [Aquificae bacterium]|nr:bifunctional (p)ppGpp synthetase/guanosine-3',5'-bis(diphosphate) 3'-pyrophosphohydrolase [Aquificota bacterium]
MILTQEEEIKEKLLKKLDYLKKEDIKQIKEALDFIVEKHRNQKRKSGEPYYIHPIEASKILAELKLDKTTIISALLHDTLEDTDTTYQELKELFGEEVAQIVDGVTKIGKYKFNSEKEAQAENFRKMIVSMSKDIRVLLVKIADRLHNIRTLQFLKEEKRIRISKETLEIYAPLAARLGLWKIKSELEDLSFKYLNPQEYKKIETFLAQSKETQEKYLKEKVVPELKELLDKAGIKSKIQYRSKHIYSIYEKTKRKNLKLKDVHDVFGIRVVVDQIGDCYSVLGLIHSRWKPVPGKIKDYISLPKSNMYQALHTTVVGPAGKFVEIQIKTEKMHKIAEEGIAAHWRYKGGKELKERDLQSFIWLRRLLEYVKDNGSSDELLTSVKTDFASEEIYVFTPRGDVITLPKGATPVDFAYQIHTEIGNKCAGAKVNGILVPLDTTLKSGDIIEILTNPRKKPNRDWLDFVVTTKARTNIKHYISKIERQKAIRFGQALLDKLLKKLNKKVETLSQEEKNFLLNKFHLKTFDDLLLQVGEGKLSPVKVVKALKTKYEKSLPAQKEEQTPQKKKECEGCIEVDGISNVLSTIAKCCYPVPGDDIIGIIVKKRGISIHSKDCPNIQRILKEEPERVIEVIWKSNPDKAVYPVYLRVISEDRPGLLADVTKEIANTKTNISSVNARATKTGKAVNEFRFNVKNKEHLDQIISNIKKVKGVLSVDRIKRK